MKLTYTAVLILLLTLLQTYKCDENVVTETTIVSFTPTEPAINSTDSTTKSLDFNATFKELINVEETTVWEINWGTRGLYGGSYYNYSVDNPDNIHYIHGFYQSPRKNYYTDLHYFSQTDQTLDYYLGFGLSKMTDEDFKYEDFHHYYHDLNRTVSENETIRMDHIVSCHPNAVYLCPENTETICMLNGTIYCMSKMSAVTACPQNKTMNCVKSTVPCVKHCGNSDLEEISMPCLGRITIFDIYEDKRGMTISQVGGTFVLVPALSMEDRTFCITVIVDPVPPDAPDES